MSNIIPLWEYVLVEPLLEETLTTSGIVLPDSGKEKPWSGKVLAMWPWRVWENGQLVEIKEIKAGDIVFFAKYSPEELEVDGTKLYLVKYSSIFAKK